MYDAWPGELPLPMFALYGLEIKLIQAHMAQEALMWVEVGAHVVRSTFRFSLH